MASDGIEMLSFCIFQLQFHWSPKLMVGSKWRLNFKFRHQDPLLILVSCRSAQFGFLRSETSSPAVTDRREPVGSSTGRRWAELLSANWSQISYSMVFIHQQPVNCNIYWFYSIKKIELLLNTALSDATANRSIFFPSKGEFSGWYTHSFPSNSMKSSEERTEVKTTAAWMWRC